MENIPKVVSENGVNERKSHPAFSVDRLPIGYEIAKSSSRSMSETVGRSQKQQVFAFDVCPFEHC